MKKSFLIKKLHQNISLAEKLLYKFKAFFFLKKPHIFIREYNFSGFPVILVLYTSKHLFMTLKYRINVFQFLHNNIYFYPQIISKLQPDKSYT